MHASTVQSSLALQKRGQADSARVARDKHSGLHLRDGNDPVPTTIFQINDLDPNLLFRVFLPTRDTFSDQPLAISFSALYLTQICRSYFERSDHRKRRHTIGCQRETQRELRDRPEPTAGRWQTLSASGKVMPPSGLPWVIVRGRDGTERSLRRSVWSGRERWRASSGSAQKPDYLPQTAA
jgi:hypothetical protein